MMLNIKRTFTLFVMLVAFALPTADTVSTTLDFNPIGVVQGGGCGDTDCPD